VVGEAHWRKPVSAIFHRNERVWALSVRSFHAGVIPKTVQQGGCGGTPGGFRFQRGEKGDPDDGNNPLNSGTLILDATCCPADIHYPTDVGLLNHARELVEKMIDVLYLASQLPEGPGPYCRKARKEYLAYIKKRTHTTRQTRMMICGNLQYIYRDIGYIEKMITIGVPLALLGDKLYRKLLGIQEICCQQWDMYNRKDHQIEDRIVSINQPHIRPIVCGKAGCPVEFGAKVTIGLVGDMRLS